MKLLKVFALVMGLSTLVHAVTIQSFNGSGANSTTVEHTWDDSGNYTANGTVTATNLSVTALTGLADKTTTQIVTFVPGAAGQLISCSTCKRSYVCVSSGTAANAWVVVVETGTMTSPTHCQ